MNLLSPSLLWQPRLAMMLLSVVFQRNDWTAVVDGYKPSVIKPPVPQQQQQQQQAGWSITPEKKRIVSNSGNYYASSSSSVATAAPPRKAAASFSSVLVDSLKSSSSSLLSPTQPAGVYWPGGRQQQQQQQQHDDDAIVKKSSQPASTKQDDVMLAVAETEAPAATLDTTVDKITDFNSIPKLAMAKSLDTFAFCSLLEQEMKNQDSRRSWLVTGNVNPALFRHEDFVYTRRTSADEDDHPDQYDCPLYSLQDYSRNVRELHKSYQVEMVSPLRVKKSYFNSHEDTITVTWRLLSTALTAAGSSSSSNSNTKPQDDAAATTVIAHVTTDYVRDLQTTGLICRQHDYYNYESAAMQSSSTSSSPSWKNIWNAVFFSAPSGNKKKKEATPLHVNSVVSTPFREASPPLAPLSSSSISSSPGSDEAALTSTAFVHHKTWSPSRRIIVPSSSTISDSITFNNNKNNSSNGHNNNNNNNTVSHHRPEHGGLQREEETEEKDPAKKPPAPLHSWAASSGFQAYFGKDAAAASNTCPDGASQRKDAMMEQQQVQQQQHQQHDVFQSFSDMLMGLAKDNGGPNPFLQAAAAAVEVVVVAAATALGSASATASSLIRKNMVVSKNEGVGVGGPSNANHHPLPVTAAALDAEADVVTGRNKKDITLKAVEAAPARAAVKNAEKTDGDLKKNPLEQAHATLSTSLRTSSSSSLSSTPPSWLNVTSFLQTSGEALFPWNRHHGDERREHYPPREQQHVVKKTRVLVSKTRRVIKHDIIDQNDEVSLHQVYASSPDFSTARTISLRSPVFLQHVEKLQEDDDNDDDENEPQDYVPPVVLPRIKPPPSYFNHVKPSFVPPAADHKKVVVKSLQWATERTETRRREWHAEQAEQQRQQKQQVHFYADGGAVEN